MDTITELPLTARSPATRGPLRIGRVLLRFAAGALGVLALAAAAGAAYETIAATGDRAAYPAAGHLVDIGGYRLHLDCRGEGSPTIVLDAGLGGSSLDWTLVQSKLAATTRVCSYDRAGMGWSDTGPAPRSPAHIADELHRLLEAGAITDPYILVGHSLAGKNVRLFAAAHPAEVAGMVLIDARSEKMDAESSPADAEALTAAFEAQGAMFTLARRLGLARLFGAEFVGQPLVSPDVAREMTLMQTAPIAVAETIAEGSARAADDARLIHSGLGTLPLVVIAAGHNIDSLPGWAAAQAALAASSSNGRLVIAEHSGHYVQLERPELVIAAVREVLASARDHR